MPNKTLQKAVKDGLISQKQYDKMPEALLMGIVKRGGNSGKKKMRKKHKKKGKK